MHDMQHQDSRMWVDVFQTLPWKHQEDLRDCYVFFFPIEGGELQLEVNLR